MLNRVKVLSGTEPDSALSGSRIFINDVGGSHLWEGRGARLRGGVRNDAQNCPVRPRWAHTAAWALIPRVLDAGRGLWSGQWSLSLSFLPCSLYSIPFSVWQPKRSLKTASHVTSLLRSSHEAWTADWVASSGPPLPALAFCIP